VGSYLKTQVTINFFNKNIFFNFKPLTMKKFLYFFSIALLGSVITIASCKKDEDDPGLPAIGGFNNANEVASANLVGHFPLDNATERISGSSAANSQGATYVAGKKGNCVNFASGYLAFNPIAKMTTTTTSYSISAWVKMSNNGSVPSMLVSLTRPSEWAGNFNLMVESGQLKPASDTLKVKALLVSQEGSPASASFQDNLNDPSKGGDQAFKGAGKWSHVVATYDAATSKIRVYGNGKLISNAEWEDRKFNGNPLGDLVFDPRPSRVVLGAFNPNTPGNGTPESWQNPMTGQLDEVRVYNKALSLAEIDALYKLEDAGR
jgi:hypothetical protein